jgi:hypothetical protein
MKSTHTSAPPASSGRPPQAEGGSAGGGVRARQSAPAGDKGGKGGNARQAWGDARKTRTHTHTQLSRPRSPPQAKGGEKSRLVQNPRQSPPQTEGEGGKRPRQCGTRAKRALCAHTHTQQAQAPPQAMSRRAQARRGAAQRWYRRAWRAVNAHGAHSSSL